MTNQIETPDTTAAESDAAESNALLSGLRRVLMAGIGAAVLAQEEIEDFVNKLVERGEIAEGDARQLVNDVVDSQKEMVRGGTKRAEGQIDRGLDGTLGRLNIPSKSEIESLSAQIAELSKKVDELAELERD